jgi:hypothetical protein
MKAVTTPEHEWLQTLVGSWTFETNWKTAPGEPDGHATGTEVVRAIGDAWIVGEARTAMPGGDIEQTAITLGYDTNLSQFVGTFVGSMMTYLWVYEGSLDKSRRVLTLRTKGPSLSGDGLADYRDIIEIVSPHERVMTGNAQGPDGTWTRLMEMRYTRA